MIHPGLVSVSFRTLTPPQIIALAVKAGLEAIEWGGDVHVPPGSPDTARQVRQATLEAGLTVSSYGSYYRAGPAADPQASFEAVLETAVHLGAPIIRVWAGNRGSAEAEAPYRGTVAADLGRIARLASEAGVTVSLEFHDGTLTDTVESTLSLLEEIGPEVSTYWQPPHRATEAQRLAGLRLLGNLVTNLHVFHWSLQAGTMVRHPLSEGVPQWKRRLAWAGALPGDRFALLEFVRNDDPAQLLEDAQTMKRLLDTSASVL